MKFTFFYLLPIQVLNTKFGKDFLVVLQKKTNNTLKNKLKKSLIALEKSIFASNAPSICSINANACSKLE